MSDAELSRHLPLNPRVFALLAALLEEPAHGYRIKQMVEERSEGAVTLDPGSLHRTVAAHSIPGKGRGRKRNGERLAQPEARRPEPGAPVLAQ